MRPSAPLYDALAADYDEHFAVPHRRAYDDLAWEVCAAALPGPPRRRSSTSAAGSAAGRSGCVARAAPGRPASSRRRRWPRAARRRLAGSRLHAGRGRVEDAELPPGRPDVVLAMGPCSTPTDPAAAIAGCAALAPPRRRGLRARRLAGRRSCWSCSPRAARTRRWSGWRPGAGSGGSARTPPTCTCSTRPTLTAAVAAAGLEVGAAGRAAGRRLARTAGRPAPPARARLRRRQLATERRLAAEPELADLGKQLLSSATPPQLSRRARRRSRAVRTADSTAAATRSACSGDSSDDIGSARPPGRAVGDRQRPGRLRVRTPSRASAAAARSTASVPTPEPPSSAASRSRSTPPNRATQCTQACSSPSADLLRHDAAATVASSAYTSATARRRVDQQVQALDQVERGDGRGLDHRHRPRPVDRRPQPLDRVRRQHQRAAAPAGGDHLREAHREGVRVRLGADRPALVAAAERGAESATSGTPASAQTCQRRVVRRRAERVDRDHDGRVARRPARPRASPGPSSRCPAARRRTAACSRAGPGTHRSPRT